LIHPLNYNYQGGEELRLLNIEYAGGDWQVPDQLVQCSTPAGQALPLCDGDRTVNTLAGPVTTGPFSPNRFVFTYRNIVVSPGSERIEDDEAATNYNSPIAPDVDTCIISVDQFFVPGPSPIGSVPTGEGMMICGADPGEPGYAGFGVLAGDISTQY
jgi:hypothetical protein